MGKPDLNREVGEALDKMIADGVVDPVVGARFPFEQGADAFRIIEERRATGKIVVEV
jgi:NADPH2:quinone reductase